jgi:hypothetical protein
MRYKFSELTKAKRVRKHQISMGINYGIGEVIFIYFFFDSYNYTPLFFKLLIVCGIIAPFFAWRYFLNQTKRILSNEYEIEGESLIIHELGQIKKTIQFRNIIKFEKASLGFKIYSYQSEPSFIFYEIENEDELISTLKSKIPYNGN